MRRFVLIILIMLSFSYSPLSHASQVDGLFNTTLGSAGYVNWNSNLEASLLQVIKLSDGKVLHFGSYPVNISGPGCTQTESWAAAFKANSEGVVDVSFGTTNPGSFLFAQNSRNYFVSAIEGNEGEIYLLGVSQNIIERVYPNGTSCDVSSERVFIVKILATGTVDVSFGESGYRDIETVNQGAYPSNLLLVNNETILVSFHEGEMFDLLSLNMDGTTNITFGNNGFLKLSKSNMRVFEAIQIDSTIVLFGDKFSPDDDGVNRWAISAIDLLGNELEKFKGVRNFEYSSGRKEGIFVLPQYSNSYIYIVGGVLAGTTYDIQAIRVNQNGERDLNYGGYLRNQLLTIGVDPCGYCSGDFSVDSYGRILVSIGTQTISDSGQRQSVIVRLDEDGLIDTTFGDSGKIWINYDYQAGVIRVGLNQFMVYGNQYSGSNCVPGVCGLYKLFISQFDQLPKNDSPRVENLASSVGEINFSISNIDTASTYSVISNSGQVSLDPQNGRGKVIGLGDSSRFVDVEIRSSKSGFGVSKVRFRAQTVDSEVQRIEIQRIAEKQREEEKAAARIEIMANLNGSEEINLETFTKASIAGVTPQNIEAIQKEIFELPVESRTDISSVLTIVRKFEVVDKVASSDRFYSTMLQEVGLIPQNSDHKAALTSALRKLSGSDRSSFLAIKQALDAQLAEIQSRKDRFAEVMAAISSRRTG